MTWFIYLFFCLSVCLPNVYQYFYQVSINLFIYLSRLRKSTYLLINLPKLTIFYLTYLLTLWHIYVFILKCSLPDSTAAYSTLTSGGVAADVSIRSSTMDPFSRTRNVSYRRLSTPSSSSVDCGTPRSTGPSTRDAAAAVEVGVLPDSDGDTASTATTTPSQGRADQSCGTSGARRAEPTPDRPVRRKDARGDAIELSCVELDRVTEGFHESSVCI